ncbi:vesicular inhibitory amino acid transporter [Babesia ovis]|uniref:Vesicular inhibitory amino acid transporter n=1 Tax=Babesia ovis TaxID=5869 RepID=A0A9W5WVM2_BABOV|nr:vesicular inhibitory amino acid transporter [Babesia ovis]
MINPLMCINILTIAIHLCCVAANGQQRHFAVFNVTESGHDAFLSKLPLMNDHVYLIYHNTHLDLDKDAAIANQDCYLPDNVQPGLSILSYRNPYLTRRYVDDASYVEAWCFTLTSVFLSAKLEVESATNGSFCTLNLFYNRCLKLNGREGSDNAIRYTKCLSELPNGMTIEDVYQFEKWARQCPMPLYGDKAQLYNIAEECNIALEQFPIDAIKLRHCFFHDLLSFDWVPYAEIQKKVDQYKTLSKFTHIQPPKKHDVWQYQRLHRVAEMALGLDKASNDLYNNVLQRSSDTKVKAIREFLSSHATNIRLQYFTAAFTSRNGERRNEFSFALSFECARDAPMPKFDFVTTEKGNISGAASAIGELEPLMDIGGMKAKLKYSDITGEGQHRMWTVSFTLNVIPLKRMLGFPSKIYLKVVHMLDNTLYLDNDELNRTFDRLDNEDMITKLRPAPTYIDHEKRMETASVRVIRTPFINVEDAEHRSSPIVWYGYIALDTWTLNYERLDIEYRLPIHVRYLHMNKGMTTEVRGAIKEEELGKFTETQYTTVTVGEPMLFFLDTTNNRQQESRDMPPLIQTYFSFRRRMSFLKLVGAGYRPSDPTKARSRNWWRRIYVSKDDNAATTGLPAEVCSPDRSGLAFATRSFSLERCPGKKEAKKHMDQHTYMVFTAPMGSFKDFNTVAVVTAITTVLVTIVTLIIIYKALVLMNNTTWKID